MVESEPLIRSIRTDDTEGFEGISNEESLLQFYAKPKKKKKQQQN